MSHYNDLRTYLDDVQITADHPLPCLQCEPEADNA